MSRTREAARSSGWVLAAKGGERLLRIAVVVVLARLLGPLGFGAYAFAFAFAEVFAVFTDAGLQPVLVRELARDREAAPRVLGAALVLKVLLAAGSWLAACALALWTIPAGETRWASLAAALSLFVSFRVASFRTVFDAPFEAGLKMARPSIVALGSEALSALCLLAAAWAGWPLPVLIGAQVAGLVPGAIVLARASGRELRPEFALDVGLWGQLLRGALPIGAANLFLIAYTRSDILMLQWMKGSESVGMYTAAYRLTGSLQILPLALTTSLLPLMSAVSATEGGERLRRIYRGALSLVVAAGLPIGAALFLLAGPVVALVYGAAFAPAAGALRVLAWAEAFNFMLYVMTTAAVAIGRERLFTAYAGALAALNIALNAALIPRFGFLGASWATLLAEGVMMAAGALVLRRDLGEPAWDAAARALGATVAAGAVLVWLPGGLAVKCGASAVLYAALICFAGGVTPEGAAAFRSFLRLDRRPAAGEGA